MSHDVFISYSSEDGEEAQRIREFLQTQGIRCWIDKKNLRFACQYDREIERAIRRSRIVVWLASRRSLASDYVKFEISTALNHNKPVGPVYLEPMDPAALPSPFNLKLAAVQGIEYHAGSTEENLGKLGEELLALVRSVRRREVALRAAMLMAVTAAVALGLWRIHGTPQTVQQPVSSKPPETSLPSACWVIPPARDLPPRVARLPAAEVLEIAYAGSPPAAASQAQRPGLQMEILARRSGDTRFSPLRDGDTLASETDDYFLAIRPLSGGYLYVLQVDSVGKKTWLFPENETSVHSSGTNPLEPEMVVQVPSVESKRVLYLDTTPGIEHIYAVFCAARWPELEEALARPVPPPASPSAEPSQSLLAIAVRTPNGLATRGVGGTRPEGSFSELAASFLVPCTDRDNTYQLPLSPQPVQASGPFLVIERWFRHVEPKWVRTTTDEPD